MDKPLAGLSSMFAKQTTVPNTQFSKVVKPGTDGQTFSWSVFHVDSLSKHTTVPNTQFGKVVKLRTNRQTFSWAVFDVEETQWSQPIVECHQNNILRKKIYFKGSWYLIAKRMEYVICYMCIMIMNKLLIVTVIC